MLRRLVLGIGDGTLLADGKPVYQALDLKVGLFQPDAPAAA
jgi:3-hydroxyacyl-[acyl-carrier protein] dehydratase/trans-2-decenoyl-[acyl-carrier protein] isomerase